eukprot:55063-Rhodomonas_salina.5
MQDQDGKQAEQYSPHDAESDSELTGERVQTVARVDSASLSITYLSPRCPRVAELCYAIDYSPPETLRFSGAFPQMVMLGQDSVVLSCPSR